ncbi:hypothetical protein SAMN05421823_107134 [Catalinimonas alkaloidigena]|uniref:Uncharacterized protein n=1 Tax=Catalinimonas alkaloidigena TaxID=1075417 RepID=A0A1G9LQC7_9BACT|nr:hypothetical protein [Catalinimonas alkaloidigena]SDL64150.1 hypothetical protein SAMN05421823_107134 [Catalinimonas alkaloidigena]
MIRKSCFLFVLLPLLWSCTRRSPEREPSDTTTTESATPAPPRQTAVRIDTVNVFLEVSGSMKGFMPKQSRANRFQETVADLLSGVENADRVRVRNYRLLGSTDRPMSYETVQNDLLKSNFNYTTTSPLAELLKNVANQAFNTNTVNLIISDFIYDSPQTSRSSLVRTEMRDIFADARRQGLAVSILGFTSDFYGKYFPARKEGQKVIQLDGEEVPYYVWVIGAPAQVRYLEGELKNNLRQEPNTVHVGFAYETPDFSIIPGSARTGSWYCADRGEACATITLDKAKTLKQEQPEFTIGLATTDLPGDLTTTDYLKKNLHLDPQNCAAELVDVMTREDVMQGDVNARDRDRLRQYDRFVRLKVTDLYDEKKPGVITLSLPNASPAWIEAWTTQNDQTIAEGGPKTYLFSDMIAGLHEAYGEREEGEAFQLQTQVEVGR